MKRRFCKIIDASVELADGGGDGAYDLHDVTGGPEEIGAAIAASLKETEMMHGKTWSPNDGQPLYLILKIKFAEEPVDDEGELIADDPVNLKGDE